MDGVDSLQGICGFFMQFIGEYFGRRQLFGWDWSIDPGIAIEIIFDLDQQQGAIRRQGDKIHALEPKTTQPTVKVVAIKLAYQPVGWKMKPQTTFLKGHNAGV